MKIRSDQPRFGLRSGRVMPGIALAATVALLLAGCAGGSNSGGSSGGKEPIKIGATAPLSGALSPGCLKTIGGARGWIDKVNAEGGINGRQIEFTVLDDEGDPQRGVSNARRLIGDGVAAFVDNCGSPGTVAAIPVIDAAGIPNLFPNSASDAIVHPGAPTLFTLLPPFDQQLATVLPYAMDKNGPGKVALVYIDGLSPNIVPAAEWAVKKSGGTMVAELGVPGATTDWGPTVIKLKEANPDYVAIAHATPATGYLVAEMDRQGLKPPKGIIAAYQGADTIYSKNAGAAATGTITTFATVMNTDPKAKECNETLPADVEQGGFTVLGCAFMKAALEILKKAEASDKGLSSESILEAVKGFDGAGLPELPGVGNEGGSRQLANAMWMLKVLPDGTLALDSDKPVEIPDDSNWGVK
ncbi:ABC transporter substrate-binding protein [Pseudarthrobacter siccitolerans]|uniref:ABC transporter substrate-binding protein n=1 Tax=Pseudarthrobacter siccitolerans TaxID=861266 RepID=UPI00067948B2|nr:ABC transporter substrate-binding protein [Pseudarthrobacter siccitolerans]